MTRHEAIKVFEDRKVRTLWDVTVRGQASERIGQSKSDLIGYRQLLGLKLSENIGQLQMKASDGKMRVTDQQVFGV